MIKPRLSYPAVLAATAAFSVLTVAAPVYGQEPADWGESLVFHTFSIAAIDPATGESGVAVTTRVPCVGNGVPWVRAGVGAVATQASTRTAYGVELLDLLEQGLSPAQALLQAMADDPQASRRQVGVVGMDGTSGQHTGDGTSAWAGHRAGPNYAVQGNLLVGPEVIEAVAASFESTAGTMRHLADRLIEALQAGQAAGGDARKGRLQSAAIIVADPREGRSRRDDGVTANINVCENPTPVAELRRIYMAISRTLGYRTLQQYSGEDVWQLKVMLHALGHFESDKPRLERGDDAQVFSEETITAVDAFRSERSLYTGSPRGLVDAETVEHLWAAIEDRGLADQIRARLLETTAVRR